MLEGDRADVLGARQAQPVARSRASSRVQRSRQATSGVLRRPIAGLLALEQPADVLVVADEDQHRHEHARAAHRVGRRAGRRTAGASRRGGQGRQRRDAEDHRHASQVAPAAAPTGQAMASSTPKKVATPLPPLNFSQTGNRWPRKAAPPARAAHLRARWRMTAAREAGDQHRRGALAAVADQGDQRQVPPAGAQHVGRADVARADLAHVARRRPAGWRSPRTGSSPEDSRRRPRPRRRSGRRGWALGPSYRPPGVTAIPPATHGGVWPVSKPRRLSAAVVDHASVHQRHQHPRPAGGVPSNGEFLDLEVSLSASMTHWRADVAQHQVRRRADGDSRPASRPTRWAGPGSRPAIRSTSGARPSWYRASRAGNRVSSPIAPGAASSNGRRLSSAGAGAWAETTMSTRPDARASISAWRSSSARKRRLQLAEGAVVADVQFVEASGG